MTQKKASDVDPSASSPPVMRDGSAEDEDSTADDDDLDAPSKSQSQSQIQASRGTRQQPRRTRSPTPHSPAEPATSPPQIISKPRGKGFRIGGKAKKETPPTSQPEEIAHAPEPASGRDSMPPPVEVDESINASPRKPRKPFRIGGKSKPSQEATSSQREPTVSPRASRFRDAGSPTPKSSSPPPMPQEVKEDAAPAEVVHEETPEEKAERKRAELKRRNEEIAKKQAQHKKKKRF